MSAKATHARSSKNSNQQSFEALNDSTERIEQQKNRPSNSSDFDNISDRKIEEGQIPEHQQQRKSHVDKELQNLQKLIIDSQKSIEEQFEILKTEYQERQKDICRLQAENSHLKKHCQQLQENTKFYKQQLQKAKKHIQQQHDVSSSLRKVQASPQKDFSKKGKLMNVTSFDDELKEKVKECEFKINSLKMKVEFYTEEDKKVREFLSKTLKFNPSFPMQLSTLVQSAVIQLDSNLKEVNREIENIILGAHLGNSHKIIARRENMEEQRYNHWQVLSNLDVMKEYVNECYKSK